MSRSSDILRGSLSIGASRVVRMSVSLIIVPVAMEYLGPTGYGLVIAITSLLVVLTSFSDAGLSNALINLVAKSKQDPDELRTLAANALFTLFLISGALVAVGLIAINFTNWALVFNLSDPNLIKDAPVVASVLLISIALNLVSDLSQKFKSGLGMMPAVSLIDGLADLLVLPMLWVVVTLDLGVLWFVIAAFMTPKVCKFPITIMYFINLKGSLKLTTYVHISTIKELFVAGLPFVVAAISGSLAIQADQFLIAKLISLDKVSEYAILQKLFALPWVLVNFIVHAQWPYYTFEANGGRYEWVRVTFNKTFLYASIVTILLLSSMILFAHEIIALWARGQISPNDSMLFGMAVYGFMLVSWGVLSTLLISLDLKSFIVSANLKMIALNVPLTIVMLNIVGAPGAIWSTVIAYLFFLVLPGLLRAREEFARRTSIVI